MLSFCGPPGQQGIGCAKSHQAAPSNRRWGVSNRVCETVHFPNYHGNPWHNFEIWNSCLTLRKWPNVMPSKCKSCSKCVACGPILPKMFAPTLGTALNWKKSRRCGTKGCLSALKPIEHYPNHTFISENLQYSNVAKHTLENPRYPQWAKDPPAWKACTFGLLSMRLDCSVVFKIRATIAL